MVIGESLTKLRFGIHDERPSSSDRLMKGPTRCKQHAQVGDRRNGKRRRNIRLERIDPQRLALPARRWVGPELSLTLDRGCPSSWRLGIEVPSDDGIELLEVSSSKLVSVI